MSLTVNPNFFQGQYGQGIVGSSVLGATDLDAGLFRVMQGMGEKAIVRIGDSDLDLTGAANCIFPTAQNIAQSELEIELAAYAVSRQLCKEDLIGTSWELEMRNGIWSKGLPQDFVENEILFTSGKVNEKLQRVRWTGSIAGGDLEDGIVTKVIARGVNAGGNPDGYFRPAYVAGELLNSTTVLAGLDKVVALIPAAVRFQRNVKMVLSPAVANAYQAALSSNTALATWNRGSVNIDQPQTFIGFYGLTNIEMHVIPELAALPETVMVTRMSNDRDGNVMLATDAMSDFQTLLVHNYQDTDPFDFRTRFGWAVRHGVDVAKGYEVVLYHA